MSILIKGVNMPEYTYAVKLTYFYADEKGNEIIQTDIITADQIAKVSTPHSRLIDADEVLVAMDTWDKFGYTHTGAFVREPVSSDYVPYVHYEDMVRCVEGMPAVIEAEE